MNNERSNDNNNLYDNIISNSNHHYSNHSRPPPPVPPPRTTSSSSSSSSIQQQENFSYAQPPQALSLEFQSTIYSSSSPTSPPLVSVQFPITTNNKTTNQLNNNLNYNLNENDCTEAENIKEAANSNNRDSNYLIFSNNSDSNHNNNNNTNDNSSNLVKGSFFVDNTSITNNNKNNNHNYNINESFNISTLSSTSSSYLLLNATNKNNSFLSNTNNNNKKPTINTNDEETEIRQSIDNLNYNDLLNNTNTTINSKLTSNNRTNNNNSSNNNHNTNNNNNPINNSSFLKTTTKIVPLLQSEVKIKHNCNNANQSTKILKSKSSRKDKTGSERAENEKIIDLTDTSSSTSLNINSDLNNNASDCEVNAYTMSTSSNKEPIEIQMKNDLSKATATSSGSSSSAKRQDSSREFYKHLATAGLSSPSSYSINETPLKALNQSRFVSSSTSLSRRDKPTQNDSKKQQQPIHSVPIRIERESNSTHSVSAIPCDLVDNDNFHCSMPNCNCRRYSAADIISFNIPPSSALRNSNDNEHSSSVLLSTFPSKSTPKTVNVIKKLSNLKRANCNSTRHKSNEKVKFSDVELRHLIVDNKNLSSKETNKNSSQEIENENELDEEMLLNEPDEDLEPTYPILHPVYVEPKFKQLKQSMSSAELKNLHKKSSMRHSNTVNVLDMNRLCSSRRSARGMYDYDQESDDHYYYYDDDYGYEDEEPEPFLKPISSLNRRLAKQIYVDKCGNYYYNYCLKPVHFNPTAMRYRRKADSSESDFEAYSNTSNYRKLFNEKLFNQFVDEREMAANRRAHHTRSSSSRHRTGSSNHHHHRANKPRHKSSQQHQTSSLNYPSKSKQVKINDETKLVSNSNSCIYQSKEDELMKEKATKRSDEKNEIMNSTITSNPNISSTTPTTSTTNITPNITTGTLERDMTGVIKQEIQQASTAASSQLKSKQIDHTAAALAMQSLEQQNLNKLKQQIINANPLSPEQLMTKTIGNNYMKPTSRAQLNRMIASSKDKEAVDTLIFSTKYQDLLAENASFIDSPIHLLMSHHVNQRILKQQNMLKKSNKNKSELSDINEIYETSQINVQPKQAESQGKEILKVNETDVITIELKDDMIKTEQTTQLPPSSSDDQQVFTYEYTEPREEPLKVSAQPEAVVHKKGTTHKMKIFYAILMTSIITYSSVFLLELVSCLIRLDNTNLMAYKFSSFLLTLIYVVLVGRKSKASAQDKYYYNLFHRTELDDETTVKLSEELQPVISTLKLNNEATTKKLKLKSNFYMILISLLLINFWVLSTYLFSYLFSTSSSLNATYYILKSNTNFSNVMETISACIGGLGVSLFFRNIILYLYEFNLCTNASDSIKSKTTNDANKTSCNSLIWNLEQKAQALNSFKKILLKYFIAIQAHWMLTISFFVYTVYVAGDSSVNSVLNQLCLESIVNSTKYKLCPQALATNEFFSWKNEILYRKSITTPNLVKQTLPPGQSSQTNRAQNTNNILSLQAIFQSTDKNQTDLASSFVRSSYNYSDDIYLLMISVSLINFFVSIIIPLTFIKTNKRFRKLIRLTAVNDEDLSKLAIKSQTDESEEKKLSKSRMTSKLVLMHLMIPLVFFHGFSKTILLCELNKWYVTCLNGINHLISLLSTYGVCSLVSIIILALLMVICNYKRKILFLLAFVQQLTLIILLLFWDPAKSFDFKVYYIDHVFFMCLAICDNLWLIHNIKTLVEKAHELNKSPSIILVYGYSMYCLGGFIGYALSIYFCTLIKLNLTLLLLVLLSTLYIVSESVFYLTRNI